jgi:hypothetical protein
VEFSFLSYAEIAVWLVAIVILRFIWMLSKTSSVLRLLRTTSVALVVSVILGMLIARWIDPMLPPFTSLAVTPLMMLVGGIIGVILSKQTSIILPRIVVLAGLLIGTGLISYLFDPLPALLLATACVLLADAGRRGLKSLADDVRPREYQEPWWLLMCAMLSYVVVGIDLWVRWSGMF